MKVARWVVIRSQSCFTWNKEMVSRETAGQRLERAWLDSQMCPLPTSEEDAYLRRSGRMAYAILRKMSIGQAANA